MLTAIYRRYYPLWKKYFASYLKNRRFKYIDDLVNNALSNQTNKEKIRVLDIGCNNGYDFVRLLKDRSNIEVHGVDLDDHKIDQGNFKFLKADAANLPFPDKYFDVTVSIGVLEHIEPMEKLSEVINEINRVSKQYVVIVPSIGTILEPHTVSIFWPMRAIGKKAKHSLLNFMSDEAWGKFKGFSSAEIKRFWYIYPLILNTAIVRTNKIEEKKFDLAA